MKGFIRIEEERCKGCGVCVSVCPREALSMADRVNLKGYPPARFLEDSDCTGCGICALMCPDTAITVYRHSRVASAAGR